jgi:hypothetical protein
VIGPGSSLAVLLDEHISVDTAYRLAALGFDVTPLRDRGLLRRKDWQLMQWCCEHGRAICTRNGADFAKEDERRRARGEDHPGVLVVGRHWTQDEIYWALRQYLEAKPDPALLRNQVFRLLAATAEFVQERS